MSTPRLDTANAAQLVAAARSVIDGATKQLAARGGVDANQSLAYDLAHAASAVATAQACLAYAESGPDESALVAAFLAITLSAVNDQPPSTTLAIPADFVSAMMTGLGLSAREVGLNALVSRLKREARAALDSGS